MLATGYCCLAQAGYAPVIYTQPQGNTTIPGVPGGFIVVAGGYPPLNYQWHFEGVAISNANSSEYWVTQVTTNDAGRYDVVVANAFGAVTSSVAVLRVNEQGPGIAGGPGNQWACAGGVAEFVNVLWAPGGARQWQHDGTNLPGATGHVLTLSNVQLSDAGEYRVIINNACCYATSAVVTLTIDPPKPLIIAQPLSLIARAGYDATLTARAFFCSPLSFQWRRDGLLVPGATNSVLMFTPVSGSDQGGYDLVVNSASGSVTSMIAWLVVTQYPPAVVSQPVSETVYAGSPVQFDVAGDGAPPPTYQWFFNGTAIPWATNASLQINPVVSTNQAGGYFVVLRNAFGGATSEVATLTVLETVPSFESEPFTQGTVLGESATFSCLASGQPPPAYQWFFNNRAVTDGTNATFSISPVLAHHAGEYFVVASNEAGSITSRLATLIAVPVGALDRFEWRHPLPQGNDLYDAAYGNARLVVVGRKGAKAVTVDGGASWRHAGRDAVSCPGVAFGEGLFVAVIGDPGDPDDGRAVTLQTSSDGVHWTDHEIPTTNLTALTDVAYGAGRFVAVGGAHTVLVASDGMHWQEQDTGLGYTVSRVQYTGDRFLVSGSSVGASVDGTTWTHVLTAGVDAVAGKGVIVGCVGYVWSLDEWPWTRYSTVKAWPVAGGLSGGVSVQSLYDGDAPTAALAFGNGQFVFAGATANGVLYSSADGATWDDHSAAATDKLLGVAFTGERFVALGNHGIILTSPDGSDWVAANTTSPRNFRSAAHGNGLYVAVGNDGLLMTSPDALAWTYQSIPTSNNLRGVAYKDGLFVAVGEADDMGATTLGSRDGVSWRRWHVNISEGLYDVAASTNHFVAVGDNGQVVVSRDGESWLSHPASGAPRLNSVVWGGGQFVAVGRNGSIVTSPSGSNWTPRSSGTSRYLQGVAYGGGIFVAMGRSGSLVVSSDGADWAPQPTAFRNDIEDVFFAEGIFVAAGEKGFVASSADGVVWTPRVSRCQNDLRGVIYAASHFLAVGNNETLLQSGFFGPPLLRTFGLMNAEGFEFGVEGEYGRGYWLQGSNDLEDWEDLIFFINQQEITRFLDTTAGWWSRRYYRALSH